MDVCLLCLYVVLSCVGIGLCDGLITRPEESYHVFNCVWLRNLNTEEEKAQVCAVVPEEKKEKVLLGPFKVVENSFLTNDFQGTHPFHKLKS
jgi:hypothetical protein